jgi:hypothetical protein
LTFFCNEGTAFVGQPMTCTVRSTNNSLPTGKITFTLVAKTGSSGTFSPATCTLVAGSFDSACSTGYKPGGTGTATRTDTLQATYSGDTTFAAVTVRTTIAVRPA